MNLNYNDERYYSKNPIMRYYFNKYLSEGIKLIGKEDFVLDFGCGGGILKTMLPNKKVVGYDINPELSDVSDYTKLRPDIVFASNVFEHLEKAELDKVLSNFVKMKVKYLVTVQPNEWLLFNIGGRLFRRTEYLTHKLGRNEVYNIIGKYYDLMVNKRILLNTIHVAKWRLKRR